MKKILMIAKYSHDFNYFKNIKKYYDSTGDSFLKIDLIYNLPIFLFEFLWLFAPSYYSKAERDEYLKSEISRKKIKYSPFVAKCYEFIFCIVAKLYFTKYKKIIKYGKYNVICLWGGFTIGQRMALLAAKKLGIKVFHFENGLLPETTVMDSFGTNFYNSVPRDINFYKNIEINFIKPEIKSHILKEREIILPNKFIFCPFQVATDTQILVHSPFVKTMEDFYKIIEFVANKTEENLYFVIKQHPNCYKDYSHLKNLNHPKIIFANHNLTFELIKKSEMIITINSTVGIEGILFDKKIITLGNAFYSGYGFAKNARSELELLELIKSRDSWEVNTEMNLKFLSYLKNFYLIEGSWKAPSEAHFKEIIRRLKA